MRNIERIPVILDKIKIIWQRQPDMRFNQLLSNLSWQYATEKDKHIEYTCGEFRDEKGLHCLKCANVDLFYVEDDDFEKWLDSYIERMDKLVDTTIMHKWNDFKNSVLHKYGITYNEYVAEKAPEDLLLKVDEDLRSFVKSCLEDGITPQFIEFVMKYGN